MSSSGGIGSTLKGGIQDIAAILPLLGTEHCSVQVSSALTRGYLYAASAPMSIFGSLGVVSAGFKTLVACFSFRDIEGAKILGNMGFEPQGENLSLIMVEPGKVGKGKNSECYIIESRMDELIKELNIDKNRITGVSHRSAAWNVKMMATTALLCVFSIAPYVYLNQGPSNLKKNTTWAFPVLRATGGFITATLIQLLIQRRIIILANEYLKSIVNRDQLPGPNADVEAAVESGDAKKHQIDARTWLLQCLLLIGLVASVVGYVGCFSVVQNSTSIIGPVSWLFLEAGLSILRLAMWAWNPTRDDAPPLENILKLDEYNLKPFPTCNKSNEEILEYKVLPLTRARDFLKIITSFAGLIEPFSNPDLSLYYTLTWKRRSKKRQHRNRDNEPDNAEKLKLGQRTLYITVFDHKERTTRVYTRDNEIDTFYSTKSDAPVVDAGHFLLEVEIDVKIDPEGDPVSSDRNNLDLLREHHQSILEHIQYRLGAGDVNEPYAIENSWTMKVEDTISTLQRLKKENGDIWRKFVENGEEEERNEESLLIRNYFMHPSIDRERRLLDGKRVKWIARRMRMIIEETKEKSQGKMGVEYRVNMQAAEKKPATKLQEGEIEPEALLFWEQYLMELLLLYEVKEWEQLFWNTFLDQIGSGRGELEKRLKREWRANCWKRLNPQMRAAVKRLTDFDTIDKGLHLEILGNLWASSISQFLGGVENPNSITLSKMREGIEQNEEIRLRIEEEIEDTEFRLKLGSDLKRFDQFWDDDALFECRYSRSKWFFLTSSQSSAPLEIYSHALKKNRNIIHITFDYFDSNSDVSLATICDLPRVTSISWDSFGPDRGHDPRFIKSTNNDLITSATRKEIRRNLDLFSTYIFTYADSFDIISLPDGRALRNDAKVLISFVAPTSGQSLILRVIHSGEKDSYGSLQATLGSTIIQLKPSSNSKSSLTIDDITLSPIQVPGPSESNHLSFEPGIRNDIVIQFEETFHNRLHDIELLDEVGGCW